MKKFFILIQITFLSVVMLKENPYKKYIENLPFEMPEIERPEFPDYTVNLIDFGAIVDGKYICT